MKLPARMVFAMVVAGCGGPGAGSVSVKVEPASVKEGEPIRITIQAKAQVNLDGVRVIVDGEQVWPQPMPPLAPAMALPDEVRAGHSEVLFLNHYRTPLGARLMQNMLDVMGEQPDHDSGMDALE